MVELMLKNSKLFSRLGESELDALRGRIHEQRYPAGREIFKEGDNGDGLYVVRGGLVEISVVLGQDMRRVFSRIGPGDFFGEMAVIESKVRSAGAVAVQDTLVWFIPREEMLLLLGRSPELSLELLREVSHRLREFNRRYVQEILQAERLAVVGRFARAIVHDLKNPLSVIGLTADMAALDSAPVEMREKTQKRIRQQIEKINDLVGEILVFTQGPQEQVILTALPYGPFAATVIEELRPEVEVKGANVVIDGTLPDTSLRINPKRLRRVFHNLIHNATDFMPNGGRIAVRVCASDLEVITEVEDSGTGIAPEVQDKLFEAFATYGKDHGTGLGLSICKKIVEDHRGRIWARNVPGGGAIFSFALPRHDRPSNGSTA
jgi:signal transduction histidine kinase